MNVLDASKEGGHPLYLQDIDFIQKSYKEAFEGLISLFNEDSFILFGCEKSLHSAGVWSISPGYVVLGKEIFRVEEHTVSFLSEQDPLYFKISQTYVSPSPVQYKSSGTQNVHIQRRSEVTTDVTEYNYSLLRMASLWNRLLHEDEGELSLLTGWSGVIKYRVIGGVCYFSGFVNCAPEDVELPIAEAPLRLAPYWRDKGYLSEIGTDMGDGLEILASGAIDFVVPTRVWVSSAPIQLGQCIVSLTWEGSTPESRVLKLYVTPGEWWPNNASSIYINLYSVSWPIAPK